jgi:16S rRNA (guanine1207-N2)-methyltransferase
MGRDRDARIDALLAEGLEAQGRIGRWLVAGDLPRCTAALRAGGAEVAAWSRYAGGEQEPAAEPAGEGYDGAVLRLPRGTEAWTCALDLVAGRLGAAGELWVAGANDEGIRSAERRLVEVMEEVEPATSGHHARRLVGRAPRPGRRASIDDWRVERELELDGQIRPWSSWPGLFAHGRVDEATALLLRHLPVRAGAKVLDFGCGTGILGAAALLRGAASADLVDHDALAVLASRRNAPQARVWCRADLPPGSWDLAVSNPPIHQGADPDRTVIEALGRDLPGRITPGGEIRLVTQVTIPIPALFPGPVERVAREGGFQVWRISR